MKHILFLILFISISYSKITLIDNLFRNGTSFKITKTNLEKCIYSCELSKKCISFNYNKASKECSLLDDISSTIKVSFYQTGKKEKHTPSFAINERIKLLDSRIKDLDIKMENSKKEELLLIKKQQIKKDREQQIKKDREQQIKKDRKIINKKIELKRKNKERIKKEKELSKQMKIKKIEKKHISTENNKNDAFIDKFNSSFRKSSEKIYTEEPISISENNKVKKKIYKKRRIDRFYGLCTLLNSQTKKVVVNGKCKIKINYSYPQSYIFSFGNNGRPFLFRFKNGKWKFHNENDGIYETQHEENNNKGYFSTKVYSLEYFIQ